MLAKARFKPRQIVRYANPEPGEEDSRFVVLEAHYDASPARVHVRLICDLPIPPQFTLAPEHLQAAE